MKWGKKKDTKPLQARVNAGKGEGPSRDDLFTPKGQTKGKGGTIRIGGQ